MGEYYETMAKIAYLDCFSGISGNMALGALLDCGIPQDSFRRELEKIGITGWRMEIREVVKAGLRGKYVDIQVEETQPHRHLEDIEKLILASPLLAMRVREQSLTAFRKLAQAEARAHGEPMEKIHFHEVGAVDSILDVVGTAIGLEMLERREGLLVGNPYRRRHGKDGARTAARPRAGRRRTAQGISGVRARR